MFKEISLQKKFINYKECKKGQLLVEGRLVQTVPNRLSKGNVDWVFEQADGVRVVLNHTGTLRYLFNEYNVGVGDVVRIVFDGAEKMEKGVYKGKPFYTFRVWVAENKKPQEVAEPEDENENEEEEEEIIEDVKNEIPCPTVEEDEEDEEAELERFNKMVEESKKKKASTKKAPTKKAPVKKEVEKKASKSQFVELGSEDEDEDEDYIIETEDLE